MHGLQDHAGYARIVAEIEPTAELRRVWPLQGGISSRMTVLEYAGADGKTQRAVLRVRDDAQPDVAAAAANEFRLLQGLHAVGLPVPAALRLAPFGPDSLLVGYIDGAPDLAPPQPAAAMAQLASQLLRSTASIPSPPGWIFCRRTRRVLFISAQATIPMHRSARRASATRSRRLGRVSQRTGRYCCTATTGRATSCGKMAPSLPSWTGRRRASAIRWPIGNRRLDILWAYGIDWMDEFTDQYMAASPRTDFGDLP